jgi:hypothetical protein
MIRLLGCWEEPGVRSGQNVVTTMSRGWRLPSLGVVLPHTMSHQSSQIPAADISAATAVYAPRSAPTQDRVPILVTDHLRLWWITGPARHTHRRSASAPPDPL